MTNFIIALTLVASLALVPTAMARDANRDSEHEVWHEQKIVKKDRSNMMHKTGAAKRDALKKYMEDSRRLRYETFSRDVDFQDHNGIQPLARKSTLDKGLLSMKRRPPYPGCKVTGWSSRSWGPACPALPSSGTF